MARRPLADVAPRKLYALGEVLCIHLVGGSRSITVLIVHEEPLAIRLTRATYALRLTARQAEVCVLVASGVVQHGDGVSRAVAG